MTNLMKLYSQINTLSYEERVFNYRLSRARRVVENAFGIIANRFRVLLNPIATKLKTVDDIILACCALYNFLRRKSPFYIQHTNVDIEEITTGNTSRRLTQCRRINTFSC